METGIKGPPSPAFLQKVITELNLTADEKAELMESVQMSQRRFVLPVKASADTYLLAHRFWESLEYMHPKQVEAIFAVLGIPAGCSDQPTNCFKSHWIKNGLDIGNEREEIRM